MRSKGLALIERVNAVSIVPVPVSTALTAQLNCSANSHVAESSVVAWGAELSDSGCPSTSHVAWSAPRSAMRFATPHPARNRLVALPSSETEARFDNRSVSKMKSHGVLVVLSLRVSAVSMAGNREEAVDPRYRHRFYS